MKKRILSTCLILVMLLSLAVPGLASGEASETPRLTAESSILGLADTGNKTTLKQDLIYTSGPGDINLYHFDENGDRVVYEDEKSLVIPMEPVSYTGEAVFRLEGADDAKIDASAASVRIIDGSGYYADEFILNADTLDGAWNNGQYIYTLAPGDIEWNTWGYDTSLDYNSDREWSIMGGDGAGMYRLTLELSGIVYDGAVLEPVTFPVTIYIYGRTCDDIALSTEFVENTYDADFTAGLAQTEDIQWTWYSDNAEAMEDGKPHMNDAYTDYISVVWPEGTDASELTADDVTVTLRSKFGEEYTLSTETVYGEHEYDVIARTGETVIPVTYLQWAYVPVFSTMEVTINNGKLIAGKLFDICSVAVYSVQTGGGGVTVDHTLDCRNFYGIKGMTLENAMDTAYTLSVQRDDTTYFYAEKEDGTGYLSEGTTSVNAFGRTSVTAPEDAWKGDATEKYHLAVLGNVIFKESREDMTETKLVDGEPIVFTQNVGGSRSAEYMLANGAVLDDGYSLHGESSTLKWAWTMRYQSGWTLKTGEPDSLPYVEGHYPYGFEPGESNPVYDELWAELTAQFDASGEASGEADSGASDEAEAAGSASGEASGSGEAAAMGVADPEHVELDLAAALEKGVYEWIAYDEEDDGEIDYYALLNVAFEKNITSPQYQYMNIIVPAGYLAVDGNGEVTGVLEDAEIGGYTPATAPIVFNNECSGWNSSTPVRPGGRDSLKAYTGEGIVYVSCGARSRNDTNGLEGDAFESFGKAPTPVVDLKAGVIFLKANADVLPGDVERIFSEGTSGGGQMSSILGASGNMAAYYPYLYAAGAVGVTYDAASDTYASAYDDSVFGCHCYCPIADIENADLAYAWMHYDDGVTSFADNSTIGSSGGLYEFSEFQLAFQNDLAQAFGVYINGLGLVDLDGDPLSFDMNADGTVDLRSGSYYDAVLANIANALDAYAAAMDAAEAEAFVAELLDTNDESAPWLTVNADGSFTVNDLKAFMNAPVFTSFNFNTHEVEPVSLSGKRNKNIPGFDTFYATAEGNSFGTAEESAVHFSAAAAQVLLDNYDRYARLDGFADADVDAFIAQALTGDEAAAIAEQTALMNATHILLDDAAGLQSSTPAQHWRTRNGTADEHTSFTIAYNLCLAAGMNGLDVDYSLVWGMKHGHDEGTTTGTLIAWINSICR